ncbi:MAG TPA: polysaccharide deacetylase family protein [Vicinamibacterales bacterium]|nr:polysaccharide deacetylase family protein [Vicinamibacterales bacterium]
MTSRSLQVAASAWVVTALLASPVFTQAPAPAARSVALTFDDLPAVGTRNVAQVRAITRDILDGLDRHHAPATGFVIGQNVETLANNSGPSILSQWTRRGHLLGSHTYTHIDLSNVTVQAFEDDVIANEKVLAAAWAGADRGTKFLRFPFNHAGDTAAKHDAVRAFLTGRGYQIAVCTIDTSDYVFNQAYALMQSRRDTASIAKLRAEYLAYSATEIDYYESLHVQIFGHSIPHVMLLHANRLNADLIEELLKIFETKGFRFVTLDEAQRDPAYRTPDDAMLTKFGPMWGYRWAKALKVTVNGAAETEPPAWVTKYGGRP